MDAGHMRIRPNPDRRAEVRFCGAAAASAATVAGVCLLVAALRTYGHTAADYISELGSDPSPRASLYRVAVLCAALAVALIAGALRAMVASWLLGLSAALFVGSATVTCTPGCPLPPHDAAATLRDLIHAGVSTGALGFAGLAMVVLAYTAPDARLRRLSGIAGVLVLVLMAATGVALLIQSHGLVNGVLERSVVVVALVWLIGAGAHLATRPRGT
jgi:hypothetical protein